MNKAAAIFVILSACWCGNPADQIKLDHVPVLAPAKKTHGTSVEQEYAKWSRMAFHEAGKVHTLLDYKYLGHSHVAPGVDQQQFRFWAKKNGSEFPLIVSIRYNPITGKVYVFHMEQERRGDLRDL
ncbi:DUF3889 domain-containing protein [Paenibacillus aestuarii]|uniref:DUF3889 domain-containing protein n=1 Tax=Paenibacillus aestuarii TaxID=516965 RepID=A0ABW0K2E0_9BACL|nr:DUF3889 domain-containing protein [Paenibacillus aestuarii]